MKGEFRMKKLQLAAGVPSLKSFEGSARSGASWKMGFSILCASLTISGCAKIREAAFGPGEDEDLFEVSELVKSEIELEEIENAQAHSSAVSRESAKCTGEVVQEEVRVVSAPSRLKSIFDELKVTHGDRERFPVVFSLDSRNLTAWRVIENSEQVPELYRSVVQKQGSQIRLPLFQVPVRGFGKVERIKNDLGEETSRLTLHESSWEDATHVRIGIHASDRAAVELPSESSSELFSRSRLEGRVQRAATLSQDIGVVLAFSHPDALVQTRLNGNELQVWEVAERSALDPELIKRLDRSGGSLEQVAACPAEVQSRGARDRSAPAGNECVLVLRYTVDLVPVKVAVAQDDSGHWLGEPRIESDTTRGARVFRIAKGSIASREVVDPRAFSRAASNVVRVGEFEKGSFYLRSMITDVPNLFPGVFAGAASELERVKFQFKEGRVDVLREKALLRRDRTSRADLETLMSFPVAYWRVIDRDAQGAVLSQPRYERARRTDPGVLAEIDFSGNRIPRIDSPLQYFGVEDCLGGASLVSVTDLDSSGENGRLAFTLEKTFIDGLGSRGCYAGLGLARITGQIQTHFTFSERVSFERAPEVADSYIAEVNEELTRSLGFGYFMHKKVSVNEAGNYGREGSREEGASLLDIRDGKKVRYILSGIPAHSENPGLRHKLVAATREVISHWNKAFAEALSGTPRALEGDVLELLVEGEDDARIAALGLNGQAGDLHRHEIRWFDRASETGVIGIGGPHADPRSGALVSGAVNLYGGNIRSAVESMQRMAMAEKARESAIANALSNPIAQADQVPAGADARVAVAGASAGKVHALATARVSARIGGGANSASSLAVGWKGLVKAQSLSKQDQILMDVLSEQIRSQKSIKDLSGKFTQALLERGALSDSLRRELESELKVSERLQASRSALAVRHQCAFDAASELAALSRGSSAVLRSSSEDLQVAMYRSTLAHEIGHNLGLRHNFMGSFDQANWKFNKDDASRRTYSSIMDYLSDDHITYDGAGPHDVAALRLAYSGRLETSEGVLSLTELKARARAGNLPRLRQFAFCTDENVGDDPRCRRHDAGTSPWAIVEDLRRSTLALYPLTHLSDGRLSFSPASLPGFFAGRVGLYLDVRQFIDEANRVALTSQDQDQVTEWMRAAVAAEQFLHEVVGTPDVLSHEETVLKQVIAIQDKEGTPLLFEPRIFDDLGGTDAGGSEVLVARGWKHDKIAALIALLIRDYGHPRYQKAGLTVSPVEFELGSGIFATAQGPFSPTLDAVRSILEDRFQPVLVSRPTDPIRRSLAPMSPGMASAGSSGNLLYPIVIGGLIGLDSAGSLLSGKEQVDLARTFRIGANYLPDPRLPSVAESMSVGNQPGERRFFPLAGSDIGAGLVLATQGRDHVAAYMSEQGASNPVALLSELMKLGALGDSRTPEQTARVLAAHRELQAGLAALPEASGARDLKQLLPLRKLWVERLIALSPTSETGKGLSNEERMQGLNALVGEVVELIDISPTTAILWNSIDLQELGYPAELKLDAREIVTGRRTQIFRRIEVLSDVLHQIHPELF